MKTNLLALSLLFLTAAGAVAGAEATGVTFKAVSRSHSDGFDLARLSNATVRGWAEGEQGRVEFLGEAGDVVSEGSVLFVDSTEGEARIYDSVRRTCLPWTGSAPAARLPVVPVADLQIEKVVDEAGPEIAGLETRHYRFEISWTAGQSGESSPKSRWNTVEEVWAAPALDVPGLALWLNTDVRSTGDPGADDKISRALRTAEGTPLKRRSVIEVESGKRRLQTTVTLEVTELERKTPPEGTFEVPEACRATSGEIVP